MNDSQLTVELGRRSYPVLFRTAAQEELVDRLAALASTRVVVLVTDENVWPLYGADLALRLESRGLRVLPCIVAAGEGSKSAEAAMRVWDVALEGGVDRMTPVVALGGGVVGDLAGFAASTLLRGLPLVQVPTTTMAQIDSSVGGKTGLNHPRGKNLIGTFHQPEFVFVDSGYLATLPERHVRSGLAEAVKHGAIARPELLDTLRSTRPEARDSAALLAIVAGAVAVKAEIVAADETERGQRTVLNFGHSLGHALEAAAGFSGLTHGEAVSLGMSAALALSERLLGLPAADAERVLEALAHQGLPTDWAHRLSPDVVSYLAADKKARGARIDFVLLRRLGEPAVVPLHFESLVDSLNAAAASRTRSEH